MHAGRRPGSETTQRPTSVRRVVVGVKLFVVVADAAQSVVVVIIFVVVVVVVVVVSVMMLMKMMMVMIVWMLQLLMLRGVRCHGRILRSCRLLQPSANKCQNVIFFL